MKKLVLKFKGDPAIRDFAVKICGSVAPDPRTGKPNLRNYDAIANCIYAWINQNIQYVRDPAGIEWLQSPDVTLRKRYGDCDDQAILAGALLSSIGVPTRFAVVKVNPRYPNTYSHVYLEYLAKGVWKPFDTTLHSQAGIGVPESRILGKKTVDLSDFYSFKKKAA